ncbi:lipase secretion chaperone [Cupriavidus sp. NPDC089707]|uniref:lipase secretion chaperone n=1 Tax=Cupriavidus sp. NPDC089707 TaxID=3363963 RepID=UPI00381BAF80
MTSSERGTRAWLAVLPAMLAAVAVYWATMPAAPVAAKRAAPETSAGPSLAAAAAPGTAQGRAIAVMPSLAGTDVPAGPETDDKGNLRVTRALRTYFDYFLSARHDAGAEALDQQVYDGIRRSVPEPAAGQAWQLWRRYLGYLAEVQPHAARKPMGEPADGALDPGSMQRLRALLASRNAARQRLLPDVAAIWFDDEQAYDDAMLARLDLAAQAGLDPAERQRQLAALDAALPEPLRTARDAGARPQAISDTIAGMQSAGRGTQEIGAALAAAYGAEVAQRYQQQALVEQAWQQRYDDYAARRAQIETFAGLSAQDRRLQLEALRQQAFSSPGEALQAEVMDQAMAARRAARQ